MGIIAKQSIYNIVSIGMAFVLGGINTLFLYPIYMGKEFQGLVIALLSYSNLIQPLISLGVQTALIRYYSQLKDKEEYDQLLVLSVWLPLIIIALILSVYWLKADVILSFISRKNEEMGGYSFMIISIAVATAYFDIFYNWVRVQLKSVFGNFLKEFYPRFLSTVLLVSYAFGWLTIDTFIGWLIAGYYLRLAIMIWVSLRMYTPSFQLRLPTQWKVILKYSLTIFLSGTAASLILDIDRTMISNLRAVENVAFYSVALFIAAVVEIPSRAMFQIISPLVSQALSDNNKGRLELLLKKSGNNLLIISGLFFLLINLNASELYEIVNQEGYSSAIDVILIVSIGKLFSMSLGCMNEIIRNSKYYQFVFWFSVSSAVLAVFLNLYFIQWYSIVGAAYATLIVIVFINLCKVLLIAKVYKIHPFGKLTIVVLLIIAVLFLSFRWVVLPIHPILSIIVKSVAISSVFGFLIIRFRLSVDIYAIYQRIVRGVGSLQQKSKGI